MAAALAIIYTGGCKRLKGEKKKFRLVEIRSFEDVICVIFCLASLFSIFKGGGITAEPQLCSSSTCRQSPDLQSTCSFSNLALAGLTKHWGKLLRCLFTEKRELLKLHPSWRV